MVPGKAHTQLLVDLGVARSHSRPHVSNDNPYSEAAFKTLKYAPAFPTNFGSLPDARAFCEQFFTYYNHEHRHSGIALHTPASVHYGTATQVRHQRRTTLHDAYDANPTRFRHRRPSSLDQPAQQGGPHTEQLDSNCLNGLDTFRDGGRGGDPSDDLGAACFLSKDETGADEPDPGHCAGKGVRGYGL